MNKSLRHILSTTYMWLFAASPMAATDYYVAINGTSDAAGNSWKSPLSLEAALEKAVAGDVIYVRGYNTVQDHSTLYRPTNKETGFKLKSGVKLYGGCSGTGKERPTAGESYKMRYQSALVGDIGNDDDVPNDLLIFPANQTRKDNSNHVLTVDLGVSDDNLNENNELTVVDGFTIAAGSASTNSHDVEQGGKNCGGGIYVTNSTSDQNAAKRAYQISHCFLVNNYGYSGGGIYVDKSVQSTSTCSIGHCMLFSNVAGTRSSNSNRGAGVWVAGTGTVHNCVISNNVNGGVRLSDKAKLVNCTVVHNTISAIDMEEGQKPTSDGNGTVFNTVLWGNSTLSKDATSPDFQYCAFLDKTETTYPDKNNIRISTQNADGENAAAWFNTPSSYVGYDKSFTTKNSAYPSYSYMPEEQSALLGAGSSQDAYATWTSSNDNTDLAGSNRFYNSKVDIGAYQRERLSGSRRLYVKPDGASGNDGHSWATAKASIQEAINTLYGDGNQGKGEVWVAAGTYRPSTYVDNGNNPNAPLAFQMKDGISVYGGFAGTETSISERKNRKMLWDFGNEDNKYETILEGGSFTNSQEWSRSNGWNVTSESYHVVWFAPSPGADDFQYPTFLDGVIIQGGYHGQSSVNQDYAPLKGAGVYMDGYNTTLRNSVIRYNNSGQSVTGSQGGGVYCHGGQIRHCLVYNNSAEAGGGVYVNEQGFINSSMIANNSAKNGAAVYLKQVEGTESRTSLEQILSVSVISNNTSTQNGAIYVDGSGLVEQNTIVNNITANTTDVSAGDQASRTGGLYITKECTAINNLLWNNSLTLTSGGTSSNQRTSSSYAQVYAGSAATKETVKFYNNGISDFNAATWNNITQKGTYECSSEYSGMAFDKGDEQYTDAEFVSCVGVQPSWTNIFYYWETKQGSVLRGKGMLYSELPYDVLYKPSTDFLKRNFEANPPIGAYLSKVNDIVFDQQDKQLRLYFEQNSSKIDRNGSSWANSLLSLSDIFDYIKTLKVGDEIKYLQKKATGTGTTTTLATRTLTADDQFVVCTREGTITPTHPFTYQENEAKAKTYNIPATAVPLTILGGYPASSKVESPTDAERNCKTYRTEFNGNPDGTKDSDGLFHMFRVDAGANVTLDGIAITHCHAAGTAFIARGAAMLIGDLDTSDKTTSVTLRNCIIENNTASEGAAISFTDDARNATVRLENCIINNNTCQGGQFDTSLKELICMKDESNKLSMDHVTIVNNIGVAPADMGTSSFAAGNQASADKADENNEARNTITLNTLDAAGALNFSNPTKEVGAHLSGNVYLGGNAEFRPLTSSAATNIIINQGKESTSYTLQADINGEERDLGGAPDLGAYEAILPKAGRVIYVRSYNQDWLGQNEQKEETEGNPDFNLLNEHAGTEYDGTTWSRAIMGNAICKVSEERKGNDFYVKEDGKLLPATIDYAKYSGDYNTSTAPYGQQSNAYGNFFISGTGTSSTGVSNGNKAWDWNSTWQSFNKISNNRQEEYVSGLQYAVEKAAAWNKNHPNDPMEVWVGAGVYTDYKGFVIRDSVKVYGGFKKDGNPGETDRHPLFSQYVPARKDYESEKASDYETILQVRKESPIYMTISSRELWWAENKPKDGSNNDYIDKLVKARNTQRHYVLYQPDECIPTWGVLGDQGIGSRTSPNQYRTKGMGYEDDTYYKEYTKGTVRWDGFTIRHGYLVNHSANRDGGGGVRVFRGIELENLIIVNNLSHGQRARGGGLYMDGDNSVISNSYLLRNLVWGGETGNKGDNAKDCYGGGAYMIQGTGFNMVVASNRSLSQGGGIFIESAKFYNNTIAYNMSNNAQGAGIMHWADKTTGIASSLTLYNCLLYGNTRNNGDAASAVGSSAPDMFNNAKNCYVSGGTNVSWDKFSSSDGNYIAATLANPFAEQDSDKAGDYRYDIARKNNDFRLNEENGLEGNKCLNGGTTDVGEGVTLPNTDMDYTNRIKDCEIDIGAYEADNTANIQPQEKKNVENQEGHEDVTDYVFYVTQNGAGNRSGDSPANAACADKLQSVLTKAGELAKSKNNDFENAKDDGQSDKTMHKVYVKVAGYQVDKDGEQFVYHANTLADASDPQSYTFLIPDGVWLMGGYNEGEYEGGVPKAGTSNWDDNQRDVTTYKTILSAKTQPKEGSAVSQEINGYHTVSFGKWPTGEIDEYNNTALKYRACLDGVYLTDGLATDNAGFKGMGGGAVIPRRAHVRNCVATGNQALKGGAFMMLQASMLSGSLITNNKAQQGGAVYAATPQSGASNYHAYVASCTIAENKADVGGGIYQELGSLMVGNTVIWGNEAPIDKNISGALDQRFPDVMLAAVSQQQSEFYPYNNCFVERYAVPGDRQNYELESSGELYFTNDVEFYPRPYSVLIEKGADLTYQKQWISIGVQAWDLYGKARNEINALTAGCYAISMPVPKNDKLLTRLYVSETGGVDVSDDDRQTYFGRSFYTPFNSLDAALAYIKEARTKDENGNSLATDNTPFEILMTGGTYKPTVARVQNSEDQGHAGAINTDRRMQSFEIPVKVSIFGSFNLKQEKTFSDYEGETGTPETIVIHDKNNNSIVTLTKGDDIKTSLEKRNQNSMTDANNNGLIEPWEFANPTIFDGDIKASASERKVYHVVYSEIKDSELSSAVKDNDVLLDGITIMNGETQDSIDYESNSNMSIFDEKINEIGHGGGIYSKNVSYTLNRCRLLNNIAVHGAGIYVRDGSCDIINSMLAGNWAGDESESNGKEAGHGGAVCVSFSKADKGNLHAVNSIFANNTAFKGNGESPEGRGGAIYVVRAADMTQKKWNEGYRDVEITNCIIANNSATQNGAVHVRINGYDDDGYDIEGNEYQGDMPKEIIFNSILWNNEQTNIRTDELTPDFLNHCAYNFKKKSSADASRASNGNLKLNTENMAADGPRFKDPTTVIGKEGYNPNAKWNPAAISILTDAGNGSKTESTEEGLYKTWWGKHEARLAKYGYLTDYIRYATTSEASGSTRANDTYERYMGAMDTDGNVSKKIIDIGMYEFQYKFTTSDQGAMYVGTTDEGLADGSSWSNQTSDLRGAIIAMSHPTGNNDNQISNDRKVYVKSGTYYSPMTDGTDAFTLNVDNTSDKRKYIKSLEIVGSCTGRKIAENDKAERQQKFDEPTILVRNPKSEQVTPSLLAITTNGKPVTLSGITFKNDTINQDKTQGGIGIKASINNLNAGNTDGFTEGEGQSGKLTLANCAFLQNKNDGLQITVNDTSDGVLIYNTLFADGDKNGINAKGKVDVVNATFVNNQGKDIDGETLRVYVANSVAWRNDAGNFITTAKDGKHNVAFEADVNNLDVRTGPNFADPSNEDVSKRSYRILPSLLLLNGGSSELYNSKVGTNAASDYDLQNLSRQIGSSVDVGAYECNSDFQPIIYVKTTEATSGDGTSWDKATNSLQSAINLAELFANSRNNGKAYVFVDKESSASNVTVNLPGVKVYGGMSGETSKTELNENQDNADVIAEDLLKQRKGIIEQSNIATINGLNIKAALEANHDQVSVVDGFLVNGNVYLKHGVLSTSILSENSVVKADEITDAEDGVTENVDGTLYNALTFGKVEGVKAVNVTAVKSNAEGSGTLPTLEGSGNNRTNVGTTNRYLNKNLNYWCYQLEETDTSINADESATLTDACIQAVLHNRDLAGNKRIRDGVDKGCFETWYLTQTYTATADDYPHGKSVIYVTGEDENKTIDSVSHQPFHELRLKSGLYTGESNTFSPGFLLLQHHAGLRGYGNNIKLDNVAVERELRKGYSDLCVMPFYIINREVFNGSAISTQDQDFGFLAYSYDAAQRANYDYLFDSTNGKAWTQGISTDLMKSEGMMLATTAAASEKLVLRFYGNSYEEKEDSKSNLVLKQNNNQQPWSDNKGTTKFTAKENMGWNLCGSPYLCAMNYSDMEYGRVIYPYNSPENKFSAAINTYDVTSNGADGFIPACDAIFTQTATLENNEYVLIKHDQDLTTLGTAYQEATNNTMLALSKQQPVTRAISNTAAEEAGLQDALYFNAVDSQEAKNDYDMGSDGVKIMTSTQPQLYIERNGGRYSLLSAVNIEGSLNIGVSLPEAGEYSLSIPEGYDDSKYETIWLKDAETGKAVDLLEGNYTFQATQAGEINNRFSISFNRMLKDVEDDIVITASAGGNIQIKGCQLKDQIRVYVASGLLATQKEAKASTETLRTTATGTLIVEVTRQGKQVAVRKLNVME